MSLPKIISGFEDALNIVAEVVSAGTKTPGSGSLVDWGMKEMPNDSAVQTLLINKVLNKKTLKVLGISDEKRDLIIKQTRDVLSSIDSVDYNPEVFKTALFTENDYSPARIGTELVDSLHIDEDSDLLKAVRYVLAVYLLHWTEEPDFPFKAYLDLLLLKSNVDKMANDLTNIKKTNENLANRVKELEISIKNLIPIELTVIPKSITNLIGRESVVQDITTKLESDHILCINADGGSGKTAIAKRMINNIRNVIETGYCKYNHVAWLTSSGNLKQDLLQINIPDLTTDDIEDKYIKVCKFLHSNPVFIVVDNMEGNPTPDEIDVLNYITCESTILITTRAKSFCFPSYVLPPLDRDAAVALFYSNYFRIPTITNINHEKIRKEKDTGRIEDAYKIIDATRNNALTIELLAKTAYVNFLSVTELWNKIDSGILGVNSKNEIQTNHSEKYPKSKLSINEQMQNLYSMHNLSDKQKEIMGFISLFPAEHDIFSDVFKWAGFFDHGADDMKLLVDKGWIIREGIFFSIHAVVRDSINLQNEKNGNCVSILKYEKLIEQLSDIESYIPRTMDYTLAQKLSFVPQTVGKLLSENFPYNITIGKFFNSLACLYEAQGSYDEALKYYNLTVEICEMILGKDHPFSATAYNNIAGVYKAQGNYNEALKFYKLALEIYEKTLGKNHPFSSTAYNNIAGICKVQGNYNEALEFYKMALEICVKTLGKDHPSAATTYNNIASVYMALGDYENALMFYNMALEIREKSLDKDLPSTATTYNNIASMYQNQGNYDEALKFFNLSLDIKEKTLGKDHPSTATTYNNIASVYQDQGKYDEALNYFCLSLDIKEKTLGKCHPSTATTINNIAVVYQELGRYVDALKFYKMSLKIREKTLGKDHPSTATTYNNIANVYMVQGDYKAALKFYNMALEICEKILGKDHPDTASTYNNIAGVYQELDRYEEALKFYKMALKIREKTLGKDHPSTATIYNNMASVYKAKGNHDDALKFYNMALEICEKIHGKNHPSTATTYNNIAGVYQYQGRYIDALEFYKTSLAIREKILGKNHPSAATTYNNIAVLYEKLSMFDEALKFYNMALRICMKTLGKDDPSTTTIYKNIAGVYKNQGNYAEAMKHYKMALKTSKKNDRQRSTSDRE